MKGTKDLTNGGRKFIEKITDEFSRKFSFEELFNLGFMDKNSDFGTFEEFLDYHGFEVNSYEDFMAIDEDEFDEAIRKSTCFNSWKEMYKAAGEEYALRILKNSGFDVE